MTYTILPIRDLVGELFSQVLNLDWDYDGDNLAILQHGSSAIIVWDAINR